MIVLQADAIGASEVYSTLRIGSGLLEISTMCF